MAWLSGLAGKAEEVLNNIDRSTAAVLKKDDYGKKFERDDELFEVRSLPQSEDDQITADEFLKDENNRHSTSHMQKMALSAPTTPAHRSRYLKSNSNSWSSRPATTLDITDGLPENQIEGFASNHSGVIDRVIDIDANLDESNIVLSKKEDAKMVQKQQNMLAEYTKEIENLKEQVNSLTSEKSRYDQEIADLRATVERNREQLKSVELDLEQHRARALKTLQDRDRLITELRNNPDKEMDDNSILVELNQLRQERETLREENNQIRQRLVIAHQEAIDSDSNAEKIRHRALEASAQARDAIANEKKKRLEAEEDAKLRAEEAKFLREELTAQQNSFTEKLKKQESSISKLKSQLSSVAVPNLDAESRLTSLTRTLVLKQQEVEHLTTDRNALRLQLERLEHEYQNWRKSIPLNSVNDTDDAKALLPSFLVESPFDTGVTRRVKRAYSTLDAAGIRVGVFLRRYPLARILVIIYMALLQLWVLIVLFSQSPDAR